MAQHEEPSRCSVSSTIKGYARTDGFEREHRAVDGQRQIDQIRDGLDFQHLDVVGVDPVFDGHHGLNHRVDIQFVGVVPKARVTDSEYEMVSDSAL